MLTSVFAYSFDAQTRDKEFLGSRPKVCKFCTPGEPAPTFRKDAHVIPAAFGNRTLFSNEECDVCNEAASALENDLANMLVVERAMARSRSRKGSVKFRPPNRESFIESGVGSNTVTVSRQVDENVIDIRHTEPGHFEMTIATPGFRPLNVMKALARMALFVMPRDTFVANSHLLRWTRGEEEWLPRFHRAFIPGPGLSTTGLELFRDVDAGLHLVVFWFSTTVLFLRLPETPWEVPDEITLPSLPRSPYPPHDPSLKTFRVGADQIIQAGTATVGVQYTVAHDLMPPGDGETLDLSDPVEDD